ncbi:MAG: hypothetical protein AAF799_20955 [Myxococcota bacterium]
MSHLQAMALRGLLIVGAVVGFGTGIHQLHERRANADTLAKICVDAALGRDTAAEGIGRHRARWVAERCADHARQARAQ